MTAERAIAELRREVDRVVERLRVLGPARLAADVPGGDGSVADTAHRLIQALADAAAPEEGRPAYRVPRIGDQAIADQASVVGRDLLAVAESVPDEIVAELVVAAREVRRRI